MTDARSADQESTLRWPDRLWIWRDTNGALRATATVEKPPRQTASREYGRFLSKQELFDLASKEDGIDTGRYVNNLLRVIENQTREINRLRQLRERDTARITRDGLTETGDLDD